MKIYAIKANGILEFVFFNVLGQLEDIRVMKEVVKEGVEVVKDIKKDLKEGVQIMKEEVLQDIKKDVKGGVKEVVEEVIKETTKNIEKLKMKEDYRKKSMEHLERVDFACPGVPALGELYLVDFIFALNMKLFP